MTGPAAGVRPADGSLRRLGAAPFVATVLLSAALVFLVQPMFARLATPLLGGSPSVWNVSLVCFQAALLSGYAYAHLLNHVVKDVRQQVMVHGLLLALAALVLPFELSGAFGPPDPARPTSWLIGVFAVSIAPPFAIISATAPLIQAWYARTGRPDAADPYHLYAASNAGSLIGLAAYPLLLEPLAPLATQTLGWSAGYGLLAACLILCGLITIRAGRHQVTEARVPAAAVPVATGMARKWRQRLWWITLAFIPSSLLVGVTTHIATDVASAPFLWAPPLMLYIGSFIIVFAKRQFIPRPVIALAVPVIAGLAIFTLSRVSGLPTPVTLAIHLLALFTIAVGLHGTLAADRPAASRLTEFYLLMSLGGVLGGAFNALVVPVIFNSVAEYPLMLLAAILLMPQHEKVGPRRLLLAAGVAGTAWIAATMLTRTAHDTLPAPHLFLWAALAALFFASRSRPVAAFAAAAVWGIGTLAAPASGGYAERGFFGVVKVIERDGYRTMVHGKTLHGAQALGPDALRPATYYAPEAPMGQVLSAYAQPGRIGVIGLGAGSVACHAKPGQAYVFFEIDPIVARLAGDPAHFTFLTACAPQAPIVLGDGRLTLADDAEGGFAILVIDAFSSDAVPSHLLTREAVSLYLEKTADDGVVLMHVTNRHMALVNVVARVAASLGVPARVQRYAAGEDGADGYRALSSNVVAIARSEVVLDQFAPSPLWTVLDSDGGEPWTDDYSNVPGALWDRKIRGLD